MANVETVHRSDIVASPHLTLNGSNEIEIDPSALVLATQPLYEKVAIWAEENGALSNNNTQWSYGNGATGNIGITVVEDWEIYAVSFQADASTGGSSITMEVINFQSGINVLTSQVIPNAGQTNNYSGFVNGLTIPVSAGAVIGFRTDIENGTISDARVTAWLRREVGQFVTGITLA